jgi:uncharacterized membrane protein
MNINKMISGKMIIIFLLIISFLPLLSLLHSGLPLTHDGQDHVARIANFYQSLTEGNMIPRWANNLNWGYGHPILMFLYPLPSYIASVFRLIGFSFVDSTKLVFGITYILSILTMYVWVSNKWGKLSGLIGAIIYGYSPYRFVDLYVRGAIGEHVAFIFPPLILYLLDKLTQNDKENNLFKLRITALLGLSSAGLILSHNAVSLMFFPLIFLYLLFIVLNNREIWKNVLIYSFFGIGLGFILSAFFWIPALFEGKYTLRNIVTGAETLTRFVPVSKFFWSPWNYGGGDEFSKEIGIFVWPGIFLSIVYLFKTKMKFLRWFIFGNLFIFTVSIFFMSPWSRFIWQHIKIMENFQFPWRWLSISVFTSAVIVGISAGTILEKYRKNMTLMIIFYTILVAAVLSTIQMWKPKAYLQKPEAFYSDLYKSTTDTGESSPIWSVRFMEHVPKQKAEIIQGSADIFYTKRTTTKRDYVISANQPSRIVENTLYFPGWNVYINGYKTDIQYQDPDYRGLMTFWVNKGESQVKIVFSDTKVRLYSEYVTFFGFVVLIGLFSYPLIWKRQ